MISILPQLRLFVYFPSAARAIATRDGTTPSSIISTGTLIAAISALAGKRIANAFQKLCGIKPRTTRIYVQPNIFIASCVNEHKTARKASSKRFIRRVSVR